MAGDFLSISIEGDTRLAQKFGQAGPLLVDEGTDEANKFVVDVMKAYEPYRYVARASAYGTTFVSRAQRAYVMARIHSGEITPGKSRRTQALARGWKIIGRGSGSFVANEQPHAPFVQGNRGQQSRHAKMEGWKGIDVRMKQHAAGVARKFAVGIKKAIKILGLA